jgi:hypothetical protein
MQRSKNPIIRNIIGAAKQSRRHVENERLGRFDRKQSGGLTQAGTPLIREVE